MQLLTFILGIAALIFLHELGHFVAARLLKVEVEEFGIGFPPRLVKLFVHKGTIFSLNAIPLGGFVRPKGENDPTIPGGLAAANPWVRLGVLFAGPAMNLLIGVILGMILFYNLGDQIPVVDTVEPDSPAAAAGLLSGDVFVSVNGTGVNSANPLSELIQQSLEKPTVIVVKRGDQVIRISLIPRSKPPEGQGAIGVTLKYITRPVTFGTAIQRGFSTTYQQAETILALPVRMMQGQARPEEGRLVGYKGMYDIYNYVQSPLWFFMAISISLGVVNLLPIPALDGGRILLTLPEILIKRRIPARYETMIHMVGFAVLLLLLIYINLQDFINPVQLP
jgi:regulator of sigma E protease